jgi:hypothetical protein
VSRHFLRSPLMVGSVLRSVTRDTVIVRVAD